MDIERLRAAIDAGDMKAEIERFASQCDRILGERERFVQEIFDHLPGGLAYLDRDLVFRQVNAIFAKLCRRQPTEVIGKHASEVFADHAALMGILANWQTVLASGEPFTAYSYPFIYTDEGGTRETFWDVFIRPVFDRNGSIVGLLDFCAEITPRVRLERQIDERSRLLAREEELNRAILDHIPAGIAYLDLDLIFQMVNAAFLGLLGRHRDDFIGRPLFDVLPALAVRLRPILQNILESGTPFAVSDVAVALQGSEACRTTYWDVNFVPTYANHGQFPTGILMLGVDVTARVDRARLLSEQHRRLQQLDAMKDDFLSVLSHELKTPLSTILGFTYILEDEIGEGLSEQQQDYLGKIREGGDSLLDLINNLLDMSRILAEKLTLDVQPLSFPGVVATVLTKVGLGTKTAVHRVDSQVPADLPLVIADEIRLGQILAHLLENACKFTPPGGRITLRARPEGEFLLCEVEDTGVGIPLADLPKVFEKFRQLDGTMTRAIGGTGIGLALAKFLVEAHGGTIGISSVVGQGSVVHFTIPLAGKNRHD